jgi:hypothetical protein
VEQTDYEHDSDHGDIAGDGVVDDLGADVDVEVVGYEDLQHGGEPVDVPEYDPVLDGVVVEVGDIGVSPRWVHLPDGAYPLQGSQWTVTDQVDEVSEIPPYAIVLAVIFFMVFLLGLLFLLIKERTVQGVVEVSVDGDGYHHVTHVPVASYVGVRSVHKRVSYIRHLAAAA